MVGLPLRPPVDQEVELPWRQFVDRGAMVLQCMWLARHRVKFIDPAMVRLPSQPPVDQGRVVVVAWKGQVAASSRWQPEDQRVETPWRQFVDPRGLTWPG